MTGLIRQLKLHALVGEKASADSRAVRIIAFFAELFTDMEMSIIPSYNTENVIFHKGEKFYMEQDFKNGWLRCREEGYWKFFENDIDLDYEEVQVIVKLMVEKHLKQQVGTPTVEIRYKKTTVEKHLKQQVGTPHGRIANRCDAVEKHLKQHS